MECAGRAVARAVDIVLAYQSDVDAIEDYQRDKLFKEALGVGLLASSPMLRQRVGAQALALFEHVSAIVDRLLESRQPDIGLRSYGWMPLAAVTFEMNKAGTVNGGDGCTYVGVDGYCPLAAYLGSHGFSLELCMPPEVQHPACETGFNLERVIPMAKRLSAAGPKAPTLTRLDAGYHAAAITRTIEACNRVGAPRVDWLIKWNSSGMDTATVVTRPDIDSATVWLRLP